MDDNFINIHAYLIVAALDKPTQAVLLNINEHTECYISHRLRSLEHFFRFCIHILLHR